MDYRETNRRLIPAFRSGAPLPGMHRERLLLLTTTGRRSGRPHTTPMMFHRQDGRLFVIASNVGAPRDPEWCLNLRADPRVTVEVGDRTPAMPAATAARGMRRRRRFSAATSVPWCGGGSSSCTRSSTTTRRPRRRARSPSSS